MNGYKEPGFQDRVATSRGAKEKALEQLRSRPPIDPADQARRAAIQSAKEEAQREKRKVALQKREAAEIAIQEIKRETAQAALAAQPRIVSESELKAARDARYAARKSRKS